jgi:hypothetical protein
LLKLLAVQSTVFQNVENEFLMRVAEKPAHEVANLRTCRVFAFQERLLNVRSPVFDVLYVPFAFKDSNGR